MNEDWQQYLQEALEDFDPDGRVRSRSHKLIESLASSRAAREHVLMIASATLPQYGMVEQPSFAAAQERNQVRLLVLTKTRLWELHSARWTGGGEVLYDYVALERVRDEARVLIQRRLGRLGLKDRFLSFDHYRGGELETTTYNLLSDAALYEFAEEMNLQMRALRELAAADAEALEVERARKVAQATTEGNPSGPTSLAEEIARLHALVQQGALTERSLPRSRLACFRLAIGNPEHAMPQDPPGPHLAGAPTGAFGPRDDDWSFLGTGSSAPVFVTPVDNRTGAGGRGPAAV